MKERYQAMMEQISLDDEAKKRILDGASRSRKTARRIPVRTVLVAACVCLALVGGVLAAEMIFGIPVFRTLDTSPVTGESVNGFQVGLEEREGEAIKQPTTVFSDAVLAAAAEGQNISMEFVSWDEAEEYLGVELMDNSALEGGWYYPDESNTRTQPPAKVSLFAIDGKLTAVRTEGVYLMNEVKVEGGTAPVRVGVSASLYTENSPIGAEDMFTAYAFPEGYTITTEEYVAESGLAAVIVVVEDTVGVTSYFAQFVWNGAAFTVDTRFGPDGAQALATLKQVLDAFA